MDMLQMKQISDIVRTWVTELCQLDAGIITAIYQHMLQPSYQDLGQRSHSVLIQNVRVQPGAETFSVYEACLTVKYGPQIGH